MDEDNICPNCSAEFGIKFKCDQCGKIFCDFCEAKKDLDATATHFLVKFYCPTCDGTASRIPMPAQG